MPTDLKSNNSAGRNSRPKRTRQASSLHHMMNTVEEETSIEEDQRTAETIPDHLSTSASEASSRGSNGSQAPPLLDFIGNTCMASAWFTSCFPCAVVDINDSDDYVVDRLSRESAMNTMYGTSPDKNNGVAPEKGDVVEGGGRDKRNVMYVRLPESEETTEEEEGKFANDPDASSPAPIGAVPSVIREESSEDDDDDAMEDVSLDEQPSPCMGLAVPATPPFPEREDSGILDDARVPTPPIHAALQAHCEERPVHSPPKKKRFGMKKLFSRRSKGKG